MNTPSTEKGINPLGYIPGLDAIRAIAVILVVFHHLTPSNWSVYLGPYAVALFFVLSGFLISRILFHEKEKYLRSEASLSSIVKRFYIRRSLRILPIYYLLFICLYTFHNFIEIDIKGSPWYYISYTSNFLIFKMQSWIGMFSHTWSLSVEEQFYLLWPFFILYIPLRYLRVFMYGVIILGFTYSLLFPFFYPSLKYFNLQTIACMPAFAVGSLIGFSFYYQKSYNPLFLKLCNIVSIIFPFILLWCAYFTKVNPADHVGQLYYGLPAACFIIHVIHNQNLFLDRNLYKNKVMEHLGKISYGIYLYHMPIYYLWPYLNHRLYKTLNINNMLFQNVMDVIFCTLLTYIISICSWRIIEKPINKLKNIW